MRERERGRNVFLFFFTPYLTLPPSLSLPLFSSIAHSKLFPMKRPHTHYTPSHPPCEPFIKYTFCACCSLVCVCVQVVSTTIVCHYYYQSFCVCVSLCVHKGGEPNRSFSLPLHTPHTHTHIQRVTRSLSSVFSNTVAGVCVCCCVL